MAYRTFLKSKMHRVRVTASERNYEGSCAIDGIWLDAIGVLEYEQIHIYNVTNGERLVTYAIRAPEGSGAISVNGAAALKAAVGDIIIIACYEMVRSDEVSKPPLVLHFDENNKIK